ncbi:acylphosphatase [Lysobacter arenosi]|jgi:acylphosphatase|uniref:Acylphosphatase n=1 Tax=Lysobacter arenosi TaxID=2795387 RepID=A0ABX7RI95_9GAMM|nr:acylphosphatase [Lysobacter arenosi]QSX76571.1 acylphosphatase [Lysobacter arenosi]
MSAARFIVSGRVQGVFFRASARDQALALGLRGFARNLPDGRVEVLAAGDDVALDRLAAWLRQGPEMARVDDLERLAALDDEAGEGFFVT